MSKDPVIKVRDVWKSFKMVQAVKGIDLNIPKGQFVALLGPNGAGKTTTIGKLAHNFKNSGLKGLTIQPLAPSDFAR